MSKIISILLIDRDQKAVLKLKKYFQNKGIKVTGVDNIQNVYSLLETNCPDTILVNKDIEDNIGLLNGIGKFNHIPKIFLTIRGLKEDRIQGYRLGCSAYISKPFDPEELEAIINNTVNHAKEKISWLIETYIKTKASRVRLLRTRRYEQTHNLLLTPQEKKILKRIIENKTNNQIAVELKLTKRNIEKHITRLLDKTNVQGKKELKTVHYLE